MGRTYIIYILTCTNNRSHYWSTNSKTVCLNYWNCTSFHI